MILVLLFYAMGCLGPSWHWLDPTATHPDPTATHPDQWRYFSVSGGSISWATGVASPDGGVAEMYGIKSGFAWQSEYPNWLPMPVPAWNDSFAGIRETIIPLWYLIVPAWVWSWFRWKKLRLTPDAAVA